MGVQADLWDRSTIYIPSGVLGVGSMNRPTSDAPLEAAQLQAYRCSYLCYGLGLLKLVRLSLQSSSGWTRLTVERPGASEETRLPVKLTLDTNRHTIEHRLWVCIFWSIGVCTQNTRGLFELNADTKR
jgi:hypothetical protein